MQFRINVFISNWFVGLHRACSYKKAVLHLGLCGIWIITDYLKITVGKVTYSETISIVELLRFIKLELANSTV